MKNKVVIITGSSGALGSKLAINLAKEDAKLVVCYYSNRVRGEEIVKSIQDNHGSAVLVHLDVTDPDSIKKMVETCLETYGSVDVLINCAGISHNGMSWRVTDEDWRSIINTNLTGTFQCCRAILPTMRAKRWGRIINITSIVGQIGILGTSAYAASKAGVIGLTKSIAVEVATKGITVNAIALGYFDEGIISQVPKENLQQILASIPLNRLGSSEEMVGVVKFLCNDDAGYITGQTINVNGGLYA